MLLHKIHGHSYIATVFFTIRQEILTKNGNITNINH